MSAAPVSISADQARLFRMFGQRLAGPNRSLPASTEEVVRQVAGLQAQDLTSGEYSLRPRSQGITAAEVANARLVERSIIWSWAMRGTLHLIASEDYPWIIDLVGPPLLNAQLTRLAQLGLTAGLWERGVEVIHKALADEGPLTREQIATHLEAAGIPTRGQALIHLIGRACYGGLICHGPGRGRGQTFTLLADWIGTAPPRPRQREAALDDLARRYLAAYAPAGAHDLATWSGLSLREVRPAFQRIARELIPLELNGAELYMLASQKPWLDENPAEHFPIARLLPRFDTYLLGHASRDLILDPIFTPRFKTGGGLIAPVLLLDGRVAATWASTQTRHSLKIAVNPFESLPSGAWPLVEAEANDLARFSGLQTRLHPLEH